MSTKFDLNKFLQQSKLFTTIDYSGITTPDISGVQQTTQNFEDWRKSQDYKTNEEKLKEAQEKASAAMAELGNSEDVYDWYNAFQDNPRKQAEFRQQGAQGASMLMTVPLTIASAGTMGWVPALTSTATGFAGAYGGQKAGEYIDNKYGTNTTPWLSIAGGLIGGTAGAYGGTWGYNQHLINKAFRNGQLKWGTPTSYTAYHQSNAPITKFKFPFKERWDVKKHGADPNGVFFTVDNPAEAGFLSKRPYTGQFQVSVQKPLIQTGEIEGVTKNGLRNAIVKRARRKGADAVLFDGIADNQLQNQKILFATDKANINFAGGPGKVKYFGPTMGKTTLSQSNNNYVDLDQLVKPLRKEIAKQLGLKVSDPAVSKSPEYQKAVKQLIEEFQTNNLNAGKTLVGSQKQLLNGDFVLDGEPVIPDFETFVARNQARGFRETPEQLRKWYDSILEINPNIKIDNRFASEVLNPQQ